MDSIPASFFGEETINRVSFLRTDLDFINATISFPSTNFIFYVKQRNNIIPLISKNDSEGVLKTVIRSLKSLPPHFQKLLSNWGELNKSHSSDILNFGFTAVFLGIDEDGSIVASDDSKFNYKDKYIGTPVYAIYLNDEILTSLSLSDVEPLVEMMNYFKLDNIDASIMSYGKMYLDWLHKYNFCPGCGTKMIPVDGGTKLLCLSDDLKNCPIKQATVNNVCFPRTDPVVITCITNTKRDKILLGLNRRHKFRNMYSCVAGFMEPSETIEKATIREIWEETGCRATKLEIKSSQPWPFPVNLMIGCIAYVEFNGTDEIINLDHDKELQDARWFDVEEIAKMCKNEQPHPEGIRLPMDKSIAFSLIKTVVDEYYKST